jgi:putative transposase
MWSQQQPSTYSVSPPGPVERRLGKHAAHTSRPSNSKPREFATSVNVSLRQNLKGDFAWKKERFSVEQIVSVLKQAELGVPVAEVIGKVGIREQTFYRWKKQSVGMETDHARQRKQLQEENRRLKQLVADLSLDKTMLQDVLRKKF